MKTMPIGGDILQRIVSYLWNWFLRVPQDPRLVQILIWVNTLGAIYGFDWYRVQLSRTSIFFWPVVPDSPLSTLLFGIMLLTLWFGRRPELLMGLAYVSMTKYGFWTALIFSQAWATRGFAYWEELFLFSSHLAMAVEALLFYRYFAPRAQFVLAAGAWSLFNDYMDYVHGFHPYLPFEQHLPYIRVYSPLLTLAVVAYYLYAYTSSNKSAPWYEGRRSACGQTR